MGTTVPALYVLLVHLLFVYFFLARIPHHHHLPKSITFLSRFSQIVCWQMDQYHKTALREQCLPPPRWRRGLLFCQPQIGLLTTILSSSKFVTCHGVSFLRKHSCLYGCSLPCIWLLFWRYNFTSRSDQKNGKSAAFRINNIRFVVQVTYYWFSSVSLNKILFSSCFAADSFLTGTGYSGTSWSQTVSKQWFGRRDERHFCNSDCQRYQFQEAL